jgi:outer membrane protein assembly factor BamB
MRTLALLILVIIAFQSNAQKMTKLWSTPQTLKVPESVLYNNELDVAFVACMNDEQNEKTGDGYIAQINLKGEIINGSWLTGLNDPKGMAIHEGKLFVSDMNELVVIDIESAVVDTAYLIPDASFFNDVTVSKNGVVFVSDSHEQHIYALKDSTFSLWLDDPKLGGVNGLWAEGDNLYAGNNSVWAIDQKSKSIVELFSGTGGIDGLETIGNRNFIFSNWGGRIYISDNGKVIKLLDTSEVEINTADIDYIPKKNLVLVPTFFTNRIDAYELDMKAEKEEE